MNKYNTQTQNKLYVDGDFLAYHLAPELAEVEEVLGVIRKDENGEIYISNNETINSFKKDIAKERIDSFINKYLKMFNAELEFIAFTTNLNIKREINEKYKCKTNTEKKHKAFVTAQIRKLIYSDYSDYFKTYEYLEADDIISTKITQNQAKEMGNKYYVLGEDKDYDALKDIYHIIPVNCSKNNTGEDIINFYTKEQALENKIKRAYIGDASDRIKGLDKCGPATYKNISKSIKKQSSSFNDYLARMFNNLQNKYNNDEQFIKDLFALNLVYVEDFKDRDRLHIFNKEILEISNSNLINYTVDLKEKRIII